MSELIQPTTDLDPTLIAPNPKGEDLKAKVETVISYFGQEFGLDIGPDGVLSTVPTQEQLALLKEWHEKTSADGIDMPDFDTFTAKMVLARALMPQTNERGEVQYLFGKGVGAELALQGDTVGRAKRLERIPYRTHSDFEIYAIPGEDYPSLPYSERFRAVFGSQEIYPTHKTKGLSELPLGLLHGTAETVDLGGISFLVPQLEMQFVDKFEKANEGVERTQREKTDAEWLASAYELNGELVHEVIDKYVIAPETANFKPAEEVAEHTAPVLQRKMDEAAEMAQEDGQISDRLELNDAIAKNFLFAHYSESLGVDNVRSLLDDETGRLREDIKDALVKAEQKRQSQISEMLKAKHQAVDEVLREAA